MKNLADIEISSYIRSQEWRGKAGGYAIQGIASVFIPFISGSYSNVVGLPLTETANLLIGAGYPIPYEGVAL
jgi:septum formation protein